MSHSEDAGFSADEESLAPICHSEKDGDAGRRGIAYIKKSETNLVTQTTFFVKMILFNFK